MNKISKEFNDYFARDYLLRSTIEGLESIIDKLSVVKSAKIEDIRLYIESYRIFGFAEKEAISYQFSQSISRIVYRRIGAIIEKLIFEAFQFSNKFECNCNVKFKDLVDQNKKNNSIPSSYYKKEAGDIILFDKKQIYEVKWSFATTAGNELEMILSKAKLCKSIGYNPILLIFSEPIPLQAKNSYQKLKNRFNEYGKVFEKSEAWNHVEEMTEIDVHNVFKNHLIEVTNSENVKKLLEELHNKIQLS